MNPRVLVTGAGGAAGVAVVKHLADQRIFTVAVDSDPFAAGLFLADHAAEVPPASDPDRFLGGLAETTKRFEVDVVVSTVAEEMRVLAGREVEIPASLWLPARASIDACIDKARFAQAMQAACIPVPQSASGQDPLGASTAVPGPWIVKPRFGRGSRDVYAVDGPSELEWACRRVTDPIVQTRITGREFTVDLLTDRSGELVGAVPRWRLETKAGISTQGLTFVNSTIVDVCAQALRAVQLCGAANLQGFVTANGGVSVIEINPRFSGGLSLSLAAGSDLVGEYLRIAQGSTPCPERTTFRAGVRMTRHFQEVIL